MTDFELWLYRGTIAALLVIVWQMYQTNSRKQEKKNEIFFDAINELRNAIVKLTASLEGKDKLCDLRHETIEEQFSQIENKAKKK